MKLDLSYQHNCSTEQNLVNSRVKRQQNYFLSIIPPLFKCIECSFSMCAAKHYSKFVLCCQHCAFCTNCRFAFHAHQNSHKSGGMSPRAFLNHEVVAEYSLNCPCGFRSYLGNAAAVHATYCATCQGSLVTNTSSFIRIRTCLPRHVQQALGLVYKPALQKEDCYSNKEVMEPLKTRRMKKIRGDNFPYSCKHHLQKAVAIARKVEDTCQFFDSDQPCTFRPHILQMTVSINSRPLPFLADGQEYCTSFNLLGLKNMKSRWEKNGRCSDEDSSLSLMTKSDNRSTNRSYSIAGS